MQTLKQAGAWYRNPVVWLLIAFPLSAVITGFLALYLAIVSNTGLVTTHYYRKGLAINHVLDRDHAALRHRLQADVEIDPVHGDVSVQLSSGQHGYVLPARVHLHLLYATRAGLDARLVLRRTAPGHYVGALPRLVAGPWFVQMQADDWRLFGSLRYPAQMSLRIRPTPDGGVSG